MAKSQSAGLGRRQIEEKIVALAWKDDGFRRKFLQDPKGQFEARLGSKLPPALKITAHQEDENSLHFVIPAKPQARGELSDDDLEKVAGGIDLVVTASVLVAVVSAAVTAGSIMHDEHGW